jgi:hypothetical protein
MIARRSRALECGSLLPLSERSRPALSKSGDKPPHSKAALRAANFAATGLYVQSPAGTVPAAVRLSMLRGEVRSIIGRLIYPGREVIHDPREVFYLTAEVIHDPC